MRLLKHKRENIQKLKQHSHAHSVKRKEENKERNKTETLIAKAMVKN